MKLWNNTKGLQNSGFIIIIIVAVVVAGYKTTCNELCYVFKQDEITFYNNTLNLIGFHNFVVILNIFLFMYTIIYFIMPFLLI